MIYKPFNSEHAIKEQVLWVIYSEAELLKKKTESLFMMEIDWLKNSPNVTGVMFHRNSLFGKLLWQVYGGTRDKLIIYVKNWHYYCCKNLAT